MMKKPNKAILDGDILAWKIAFVVDAEGDLAVDGLLAGLVKKWTPDGIKEVKIALSSKKNFRKKSLPAYKENRKDVYKPDSLSMVFQTIRDSHEYLVLPELEADDILGIYSSGGKAISVTIDKDLKGVPGWHFNPEKDKKPSYISNEEAERWFCIQWMAGDSTDGISGLWRVGKKTAEKFLDEWEYEDWYKNIVELYNEDKYKPKGKHDVEDIAKAMGQCVRILRDGDYNLKDKEIINMWSPKDGL